MSEPKTEIVFVDVDDTLVRSAGAKPLPMTPVVQRVAALHRAGATMYCWSTGGADYARDVSRELGIEDCFIAFLPKPCHARRPGAERVAPLPPRSPLQRRPHRSLVPTIDATSRATKPGV